MAENSSHRHDDGHRDRQGHGHGHRHGGPHDQVDWAAMAEHLATWDDVDQDRQRRVLGWLGVHPGWTVVDVGSGAGGMAAMMAEAVGERGTVVVLDGDAQLLDIARRRAEDHGGRVVTVEADLEVTRLADVIGRQADLVHASGVVHHVDDQVDAIRNLAGGARPGGRVALGEGGLGHRFLPDDCGIGVPGLETRLLAAQEAWFWEEVRPAGSTVAAGRGWGELLRQGGLVDVSQRSFLLEVPPPLHERARRAVRGSLAGLVGRIGDRLDADDRAAVARLLDDDAEDGIMRRPDVFVLGVRTVHAGTVPT